MGLGKPKQSTSRYDGTELFLPFMHLHNVSVTKFSCYVVVLSTKNPFKAYLFQSIPMEMRLNTAYHAVPNNIIISDFLKYIIF